MKKQKYEVRITHSNMDFGKRIAQILTEFKTKTITRIEITPKLIVIEYIEADKYD